MKATHPCRPGNRIANRVMAGAGLSFALGWLTATTLHAATLQEVYGFSAPAGPIPGLVQAPDGALYGVSAGGGNNGLGMVYRVATNGTFSIIASFTSPHASGPSTGLALGPDGALYGSTRGDANPGNYGTLFRVTTNGALTTLVAFDTTNGFSPAGVLIEGPDGALYGTTAGVPGVSDTRANNNGTVFRVTTNGVLTTLWSFGYTNGAAPNAGLVLGADGAFYGTTTQGGSNSFYGTVFRITPDGTFTLLASVDATNRSPATSLLENGEGMFYGTTSGGGDNYDGNIYRVTAAGELTTLYSFSGPDGQLPNSPLVTDDAGNMYGTTLYGGTYTNTDRGGPPGYGTIFRITTDGSFTSLVSFDNTNGSRPDTLVWGADGAFYGTTATSAAGPGTVYRVTTDGTLTTLASFPVSEPSRPSLAFLQGRDGAFYGATGGSIFRVTTNGSRTTLVSFDPAGGAPNSIAQAHDGAFYGTTFYGGASDQGTIFRVSTNGVLTTLTSFDGTNGAHPTGLTCAADGLLYGTTYDGGGSDLGTVFRVTTNGILTALASFDDLWTDGANPGSGVIQAADGNLYGGTDWGGGFDSGTVFRVTTNGAFASLVSYQEMAFEIGQLAQGRDGALYGTAMRGFGDYGDIFRITTNGACTILFGFDGTNGSSPWMGLVSSRDGALYGTTLSGGDTGRGTVFRITTNGTFTSLASFDGANGKAAYALLQGQDGAWYGTTIAGGSRGGGNIFRVNPASEMKPLVRNGNGWTVSFLGLAGDSYQLWRAADAAGPWTALTTIVAGTDGTGSYNDNAAPATRAFYRASGP